MPAAGKQASLTRRCWQSGDSVIFGSWPCLTLLVLLFSDSAGLFGSAGNSSALDERTRGCASMLDLLLCMMRAIVGERRNI
jgi:hypothetical protein